MSGGPTDLNNKKTRLAENQRGAQSVSLTAAWGRMIGGAGRVDRGSPQYVWASLKGRQPQPAQPGFLWFRATGGGTKERPQKMMRGKTKKAHARWN